MSSTGDTAIDSGHARTTADRLRLTLWILWATCLVLGIVGLVQRVVQGHLPAGYGSYVPWGLWVAIYFHGVGIAGGAFLLGAGAFVLGLEGFDRPASLRTVIVLAMAAILPAFTGVWLDLGRMERAPYIFMSPAFTSMMAFNAWMYGAFVIIAAACWVLSCRQRSGWLRPLLCLAILFSVLFPSQSGAFFGVIEAKGLWHSALLPMLFLTSAITAGAAVLLVIMALPGVTDESPERRAAAVSLLRRITLIGLIVYFVFEFAEFSITLWNPDVHAPAIELILWGPYWWVFWIVHLLLGGAVPLVLLLVRRQTAWTIAALLVAITFISARLNVLVPGQAVGEIQGLQEAFQHERLRYIYHATLMEYLVGLFLLAFGVAVFFVGQRISASVGRRTQHDEG